MLRGATFKAAEIVGTAVFRIVVSSDSMKKATATSHGSSRLLAADGGEEAGGGLSDLTGLMADAAYIQLIYDTRINDAKRAAGDTVIFLYWIDAKLLLV